MRSGGRERAYRHFADRDALESAIAAQGLRELKTNLTDGRELPSTSADLAEFAVAYVEFAMRHPALFRLMFGNVCDTGNDERVQAAGEIYMLLQTGMTLVYPDAEAEALASAGWALAHGMAFLHLDGMLSTSSDAEVAERVRTAFAAILSVHG